jgi:hypothetical protein
VWKKKRGCGEKCRGEFIRCYRNPLTAKGLVGWDVLEERMVHDMRTFGEMSYALSMDIPIGDVMVYHRYRCWKGTTLYGSGTLTSGFGFPGYGVRFRIPSSALANVVSDARINESQCQGDLDTVSPSAWVQGYVCERPGDWHGKVG